MIAHSRIRSRSLLVKRTATGVATLALAAMTIGVAIGQSEPVDAPYFQSLSAGEDHATSQSSDEAHLSPLSPGLVREVLVKKGDRVKKGQPLIQQDDRIESEQLTALKKEAESTVRMDAYKADKKVKALQYERYKNAATGTYGATEMEQAEMAVVYADAQIGVSELDHAKAQSEAKIQQIKVDEMLIEAPFDGIILSVEASPGEMIGPTEKPAITIVKNDPLEVRWTPYVEQTQALKLGDKVEVRYANEQEWQTATISYLAPVANNGRREVVMDLPNPSNREAGVAMVVKVPEKARQAETAAVGK